MSGVWKSQLSKLVMFNQGILFSQVDYFAESSGGSAGSHLPLLTRGHVKHLVFYGAKGPYEKCPRCQYSKRKKCFEDLTSSQLQFVHSARVTWCRMKWDKEHWLNMERTVFCNKNIAQVRFVNCTFDIIIARFDRDIGPKWMWSYCVQLRFKTINRDYMDEVQRECKQRTCHLDSNLFYDDEMYSYMLGVVETQVIGQSFLQWCLHSTAIYGMDYIVALSRYTKATELAENLTGVTRQMGQEALVYSLLRIPLLQAKLCVFANH